MTNCFALGQRSTDLAVVEFDVGDGAVHGAGQEARLGMARPRQVHNGIVEHVAKDAESATVVGQPQRYGPIAAAHCTQAVRLELGVRLCVVRLQDLRKEALLFRCC